MNKSETIQELNEHIKALKEKDICIKCILKNTDSCNNCMITNNKSFCLYKEK